VISPFSFLLLYTPLPWLVLMYVAAYRHDLARVARPLRDGDGLRAWWPVCVQLRLVSAETPRPQRRTWREPVILATIAAILVSAFWLVPFFPQPWYYQLLLQVISALILFFALVSRIGRLPSKPYSDALPYPRLGSRIRHLHAGDRA
jgi:hypothetical protein